MLEDVIKELQSSISKAHEALKRDLTKLRAGRASGGRGFPQRVRGIEATGTDEAGELTELGSGKGSDAHGNV